MHSAELHNGSSIRYENAWYGNNFLNCYIVKNILYHSIVFPSILSELGCQDSFSGEVAMLLDDCEVKKAAHTRWFSHLNAITSIRDTYTALVMDLENAKESGSDRVHIGSEPSAAGLVRKLKNYKFVHLLHFLCDALKPMAQLAKTFESNNVDLSILQPRLQHTLST